MRRALAHDDRGSRSISAATRFRKASTRWATPTSWRTPRRDRLAHASYRRTTAGTDARCCRRRRPVRGSRETEDREPRQRDGGGDPSEHAHSSFPFKMGDLDVPRVNVSAYHGLTRVGSWDSRRCAGAVRVWIDEQLVVDADGDFPLITAASRTTCPRSAPNWSARSRRSSPDLALGHQRRIYTSDCQRPQLVPFHALR
jgi:hypothetical protein